MKGLLDTHAWIWWNMRPQKLRGSVRIHIAAACGD